MGDFRKLYAYTKGFDLAMEIFNKSKQFPREEKYSLTDQIRRSSRAVTANLGEAYRKRQYPAHFVSKVSDADMENTETQVWLEYSWKCEYMNFEDYTRLNNISLEVGMLISDLITNPEKYA